MDEYMKILMNFMQNLMTMKEILEKGASIEYYSKEFLPYIDFFRNNVTYTYELLYKHKDSEFKTEYIKLLDLLSDMCNNLEQFYNYSLLNNMSLTYEVEKYFNSFTYAMGGALIQVGATMKLYKFE